jgi:hypothetical protein
MYHAIYCGYAKKRVYDDSSHIGQIPPTPLWFGHGPVTPTLADVYMLTGLDISSADDPLVYNRRAKYQVNTHNIGGWTRYIQEY